MDLQFSYSRSFKSKHSGKGGTIYAVQIIGNLEWDNDQNEIKVGRYIGFNIGIARCSDKDNFNKKIGKDLARSRLKLTTFKVVSISKYLKEDNKIRTKVTLKLEDESYLIINQSSQNSKFHVVSIEIF